MPSYSDIEVKKELFGPYGLVKSIRDKYIPDTNKMAQLAQEVYEIDHFTFDDIDFALDNLLFIEYEIYKEKQQSLIANFIQYCDIHTNESNFPITRSLINQYKRRIDGGHSPTTELGGIIKLIIPLADSNRQSRVSRSGASLMHHIAYLLDKNGFEINRDYHREYIINEGCKLDFFFPNKESYFVAPKKCCSVACQTTSNDRFRLTFAQMPTDTVKRACTAIGSSNFPKRLGTASLTENKINEATKHGVKFVIVANNNESRQKLSDEIISYNKWFDELNSLKEYWS